MIEKTKLFPNNQHGRPGMHRLVAVAAISLRRKVFEFLSKVHLKNKQYPVFQRTFW